MPKQTVMWTVVPRSGGASVLLSVHVAPRLRTDPGDTTPVLSDFPDWTDWPATLRKLRFTLEIPALGISVSESATPTAMRRTSTPQSATWKLLVQPTTLVRSRTLEDFTRRRIRSYPYGNVASFIANSYGRIGARFVDRDPSRGDLIVDSAFGPIAFESDSNAAKRRIDIATGLENSFDLRSGSTPANWAIPHRPAMTPADVARDFAQLNRFFRRRPDGRGPLPAIPTPKLDFHDFVSATRDYPTLQRALGLVIDLEITDPRVVALLAAPAQRTQVKVTAAWTPALAGTGPINITPRTMCVIGDRRFEAAPRDPQNTDYEQGMLKVGTSRFQVVAVDADGAGLLAQQFADNVSRGSTSTAAFALPALRTGGIGIAHAGRASNLAARIGQAKTLQDASLTAAGDARTGDPEIFLEDLVAGLRWDVDGGDGTWRSLMLRAGAYEFRDGSTMAVTEEATSQTGLTSSGDPADGDLYLHEMLALFNGWSLAVPRPGRVISADGTAQYADGGIDPDFQFGATFAVPPGTLPALRFGRVYRLRARAATIAGTSVNGTVGDIGGATLSTAPFTHRRFEVVPPPEVLLRDPATTGEGADRLVIRSLTATSGTSQVSQRHLAPPRASVELALQHSDAAARLLTPEGFAVVSSRDGARLEDLPSARATDAGGQEAWRWETDDLAVNYLADPLAKHIMVQGLPGGVPSAKLTYESATQAWPDLHGFRVRLVSGATAGWSLNAATKQLDVTLAPGDLYEVTVSSRFNDADLDLMALWAWIRQAAAAGTDLAALATAIRQGRHGMITPRRTVTLVHAVKVPSLAPTFARSPQLVRSDTPGTTAARLETELTISTKTTSKVDITGRWRMPVDNGPGTADPVTPREFQSAADAVKVERAPGVIADPGTVKVAVNHEFHDTLHRVVDYTGTAISAFAEYFRTETTVTLGADGTADIGSDFVAAMVKARNAQSGQSYRPAALGENDPATASGDFVVDAATRQIKRTSGGAIPAMCVLIVSYVAPPITRTSAAPSDPVILNSTARPAAPVVHSVLPTFNWTTSGSSTTRRGGLRVYLERPWWSSGAGERLAVVLPNGTAEPSAALLPHVTMWGRDPVFTANAVPDLPTISSFAGAAATASAVALPDVAGSRVDLAAYDVAFDADRDLWYCDIRVVRPDGREHDSYFPFLRLALARYQANSITGCHLSPVAIADIVQLTPQRTATVTGTGATRTVTVTGQAFTGTAAAGGTNPVTVHVERARAGVADPVLKWEPVGDATTLTCLVGLANQTTWTGVVPIPTSRQPQRLVLRELESHRSSGAAGSERTRTVYLNTIDL